MKINKKYKRVIQLELNEISSEAICKMIANGIKLPNFERINEEWKFLKTRSEANYEEIEPWIQWVTVHTGEPLANHKIFRLSDAHKLECKQIWEVLSDNAIESAVIGSMNSIRRNTNGGKFISDPWAQKNEAYPSELKPLWQFLASRVQQHATSKFSALDMLKALKCCTKIGLPYWLYLKIICQLISQKINPKSKWKLAGIFDIFLAEVFKKVLSSTNYGFYTLFLNSIAHYQHHYWRSFDIAPFDSTIKYADIGEKDDPMSFGYKIYDKIIGDILNVAAKDNDTLIIILSGLSQIPFNLKENEGGMNYYRLNNHKKFSQELGLTGEIYPMMSRDWQYKYTSHEDRNYALSILKSATVNGESLFIINENTEGYLYIETAYTKRVSVEDMIKVQGREMGKFDEHFTNIAIKSGYHTGIGNLWVSDPEALDIEDGSQIPLTEIFNLNISALV